MARAVCFRCLACLCLERFSEQADVMKADGFSNGIGWLIRLAQQQCGLFEAVFDEILVRCRLHASAECAQAGGLAAVGARCKRVKRDVFGVVRGDVLEDAPCAYGWHVFVLLWLS